MLKEKVKARGEKKERESDFDLSGKMYSSRVYYQFLIIRSEVCCRSNGQSNHLGSRSFSRRTGGTETYSRARDHFLRQHLFNQFEAVALSRTMNQRHGK